jgi:hypothetical protein
MDRRPLSSIGGLAREPMRGKPMRLTSYLLGTLKAAATGARLPAAATNPEAVDLSLV